MRRMGKSIIALNVLFAMALFSQVAATAPQAPATPAACESLTSLALPYTTITLARSVAAGAFTPPGAEPDAAQAYRNLPAFCRVTATVKPTSDSNIKMEVWMPVAGWNGKFRANGSAGMGGSIPLGDLAHPCGRLCDRRQRYRAWGDSSYALTHPERVIDFGYRSAHEVTVKARAIIAAYYGRGPGFAFITVAAEAPRRPSFPRSATLPTMTPSPSPGFPTRRTTPSQLWMWDITRRDEASYIPAEKLTMLNNAVFQACDALDGVNDGVLEDPRECKFDPEVIECRPGADGSDVSDHTPGGGGAQDLCWRNELARPGNRFFSPAVREASSHGTGYMMCKEPFGLAADFLKYLRLEGPELGSQEAPIQLG